MAKTPALLPAYVNHGRWVVDCPGCGSGLQLPRGPRRVPPEFVQVGDVCVVCGTPLRVVWPEDPRLIDAALAVRPLPVNRNWVPAEDVADLLAENVRNL